MMDETTLGVQIESLQSPVTKKGSYDKVALVANEIVPLDKQVQQGKTTLANKLRGWWNKNSDTVNEALDVASLAGKIIEQHKISEADFRKFPTGLSDRDQFKFTNIIAAIAKYSDEQSLRLRRDQKVTKPYDTGLVIADLLEVMPRELAARVLYSASNPNIAQSVLHGEGTLNLQGVDTQPYAVEAMILLPKHVRHEIFSAMANLEPGREGRAHRLFSLIAANWGNRNSDYNGSSLIYANLQGETASEKVLEVQADIQELGPLIRGESPAVAKVA